MRLRSLFTENVPYKALSVLIALALWFIVRDERIEDTLRIPVDVQTSPDLVMSNESLQDLSVRVTGTRAALDRLHRGEQVHSVRLKNTEPGLVTVRVRPEDLVMPAGVEVVTVTPASTSVRLEARAARKVPVRPRVVLDAGGEWQVKKVTVTPERVRIAGPQSVIAGLEEVWTEAIAISPKSGDSFTGSHAISLPHRQLRLEEASPVTVRIDLEERTRTAGPPG